MRHPRTVIILFTLVSLLAAPRSAAAASSWTALGPFGGTVLSLAVDPADERVVYATTGTEGVFRSADAGATWTKVARGFTPGNVAVAPGGVIYASVHPGKIKKSTDGGVHWAFANQGLPDSIVIALAVDPAQPSRVYAALPEGGMWRSTDGGASWQPANVGLAPPPRQVVVKQIAAVRKPAGTVYIGTNFGLYKSWDGGRSWHLLRGGLPADAVQSLAVSPTDPRTVYANLLSWGLFRSTDGGARWTRTAGQLGFVNALAVSPRSPRLVLAGSGGSGLFRSTDGGERWTAVGPASARFVRALAVSPTALRFVYAGVEAFGTGEPGGILASEDGGLTWARRNRGLAAQDSSWLAVSPLAPGNLWTLANQQGLLRTRNGGANWRRPALPDTVYGSAGAVAVPPLEPSTVYVLSGQGLWKSVDNGVSWSPVYYPGGGPASQFLWADPLDPDGLWTSTREALYRSDNGGVTWTRLPGLDAFYTIVDLAFAPSSPKTVYVAGVRTEDPFPASHATLYRSEDGGATWTRADTGLDAPSLAKIAVDPVDPRRIYVAARGYYYPNGGGVWVSGDGGATWALAGEELRGEPMAAVAASAVAGVVWTATQDGRIFRSGDGGAAWEERTASFPPAQVRGLAFDPFDARRLYASTTGGVYATVEDD